MANQNIINSKGIPLEASNSRGGVHADSGPYIGVVMDNKDATRTGRVRVWLRTHSSEDRNNEAYWRTVRYMSPFYGTTPHSLESTADSNFDNNGHAYGMWMTAPDVGVEVLCFFVDGDPNKGYYVGCIPEPQMNHMLPGTGASANPGGVIFNNDKQKKAFENASRLPTIEMDRSMEGMNDATFASRARPIHSVVAAQMWQAGTITDNVRGPIGSSAQRESPSYAYGISTPGRPVLASGLTEETIKNALGNLTKDDLKVQGRRGGHSFVMDDGDLYGNDVLMRLRTSTGHQILLSDDGAAIHIIHANGQTWIELGNEGTVDIYAANSINLRSQGELNLHADKNVNIHAGENFNVYAKENLKIESEKKLDLIGKKGLKGFSSSDVELLADKNLNLHSKQTTSVHAEQKLTMDGTRIDLNTSTGNNVTKPEFIPQNSLNDVYFEEPAGWVEQTESLKTCVSRAPTHEPYSGHNKGVPVKIETQSSSTSTSSATTSTKVAAVADLNVSNPVTAAETVKQIQNSGGIKEIGNCSQEQVAAVMAQTAKNVGQDVNVVSEKGIGKFGIQPQALEDLGVIKPGMVALDQMTPDEFTTVMSDSSMFTGKYGIDSLDDLLDSEETQSTLVQDHYSYVYDALSADDLITSDATALDQSALFGASTQAGNLDSLKQWFSDSYDSVSESVSNTMDSISNAARNTIYAASMAVTTGKALLNIATSSSSSGGKDSNDVTKTVATVDRAAVDKATDELVGSSKIPSLSMNSTKVQNQIKLDSGQVLGVTDALGNIVDKDGNVIAGSNSGVSMVYPEADAALTGLPTTASNVYSEYSGTALDAFGNIQDSAGNLIGRFASPSAKQSIGTTRVSAGGSAARRSSGSVTYSTHVSVGGGSGSSSKIEELDVNYYAQSPYHPVSNTGKELGNLSLYAKTLINDGIKKGSNEYYSALYDFAGVSGLSSTQVANQLKIDEKVILNYRKNFNKPPLNGYPNFYAKLARENDITQSTSNQNRTTSSAAGSFDMKSYHQKLAKQGLSKDQQAKLLLAKMRQTGMTPSQMDSQLNLPSGSSANYIKSSNGGRKNVFK